MSAHLDDFARRLSADPYFLAAALDCYAASVQLDEAAVAAKLGCSLEILTDLRLCRMPRTKQPHFRQDVDAIAGRFGIDALVLAEVVRHGHGILKLRSADSPHGGLMAARDRENGAPDSPAARESP